MKSALAAAVWLLAACGASADHPDVILLVLDTTRADHCSLNGYERPTTPFLESLAREGTVYTDAWAPTCWTGPSHASMFTGLRPEHHGYMGRVRTYLDPTADTLAEVLSRAGYESVLLSCNPSVAPPFGLAQGFGGFEEFQEDPALAESPSERANARALEFVERCRSESRPYFLFVNHFRPHLPYDPPEEFARRFLPPDVTPEEEAVARRFQVRTAELLGRTTRSFTPRQRTILRALYDAEIATLDEDIRQFVEALRAKGALDDAVLVIVGDHGENLGDHELWGHFMDLHRAVRLVPLLVRYPAAFTAGARVDSVVRVEDVVPTILGLCGQRLPADLDGISLLKKAPVRVSRAVLGGEGNDALKRDYPEYYESGDWHSRHAVYDGRYHLIRREDGMELLYDVKADPSESKNLASEHPELLPSLRRSLPRFPWNE